MIQINIVLKIILIHHRYGRYSPVCLQVSVLHPAFQNPILFDFANINNLINRNQ